MPLDASRSRSLELSVCLVEKFSLVFFEGLSARTKRDDPGIIGPFRLDHRAVAPTAFVIIDKFPCIGIEQAVGKPRRQRLSIDEGANPLLISDIFWPRAGPV